MKVTKGIEMNVQNKSGLSLVELMVAVAVAGIAFSGIFAMSTHSMKAISYCKNESNSMQAAQYELEKIRTYSWEQLLALGGSYVVNADENYVLSQLNSGRIDVLVTGFPNGVATDTMRAVSVEVSFLGYDGAWDTNTLVTLIAEEGMKR